jgi:hypothetical protein
MSKDNKDFNTRPFVSLNLIIFVRFQVCRLKSIDFGLCVGMSFNMFVIVEKYRKEKSPYAREMK